MKYVYGPVPSRRLGKSLGIDPVPLKTCNWNCVYCQLGRTAPLTLERGEYVPRDEIVMEFKQALAAHQPEQIDWVTFVGSGEPTLHVGLGWLIRQVKTLTKLPVAVITNGSLLYLPEVREELLVADAVMPTLDAGNAWLYRHINRAPPRFSFDRLLEGLSLFREMFAGKLWVELMLIKDMNDTEEALQEIGALLGNLKPDSLHITLPIRPPAEAGIRASDEDGLKRAQTILGKILPVSAPNATDAQAVRVGDLSETILSIVSRHPMQEKELLVLLNRWTVAEVRSSIEYLAGEQSIRAVKKDGHYFWSASAMSYSKQRGQPDETNE